MIALDGADSPELPLALVAWTVNVYAVPLVRPVTVIGDPAELALMPPGFDVAVYEVIGEPPSDAGGVNVTVACALPAVAVPMVGAPGTAAGVALFDALESAPLPTVLVALTLHVYAVPLVKPVTTIGEPEPLADSVPQVAV